MPVLMASADRLRAAFVPVSDRRLLLRWLWTRVDVSHVYEHSGEVWRSDGCYM